LLCFPIPNILRPAAVVPRRVPGGNVEEVCVCVARPPVTGGVLLACDTNR
jgi:hypothetical protein